MRKNKPDAVVIGTNIPADLDWVPEVNRFQRNSRPSTNNRSVPLLREKKFHAISFTWLKSFRGFPWRASETEQRAGTKRGRIDGFFSRTKATCCVAQNQWNFRWKFNECIRENVYTSTNCSDTRTVSRVFAIFGKNWGPIETGEEKKKKGKRKKSIPPLVSRRLEIISSWTGDSATIPETDLISWISPALKRTTDGEKGRKSRESRVARVSSSPDFSAPPLRLLCLRENRLSRINQSRPWFLCCVWSVVGHETCFVKCKEEREEERRRSLCKGKKEEEGKERWRGRGKS